MAERLGGQTLLHVRIAGGDLLTVQADGNHPARARDVVGIKAGGEHCHLFDESGRGGRPLPPQPARRPETHGDAACPRPHRGTWWRKPLDPVDRPTAAIRLNAANLGRLPAGVQAPAYDRGAVTPGIVHIGVGGFHRAHQAAYLDDLLHQPGHPGWGLCGVGLLRHDDRIRDALRGQDCLYTLVTRGSRPGPRRVIGSIVEFLYAPDDPEAVIEKMAAPETRIVSLTITDRGYYVNHGTGQFDDRHPDILHDLAQPAPPGRDVRLPGRGARPPPGPRPVALHGHVLRQLPEQRQPHPAMLLAFLKLRDPSLHDWVGANGAFPNSMVDRITPVTTDEHRALVRDRFGMEDAWPVTTEPFTQWVIEDHFAQGRPPWERVGRRSRVTSSSTRR